MGIDRDVLMTRLGAMAGAAASAAPAPGGRAPQAMIYKVMGKMFAIVGLGKVPHVILKCDPHLAEVLKETYAGVGHRSHLDPRNWISVELEADVPEDEIGRLAAQSYERVCAGLTRKQREELGGSEPGLSSPTQELAWGRGTPKGWRGKPNLSDLASFQRLMRAHSLRFITAAAPSTASRSPSPRFAGRRDALTADLRVAGRSCAAGAAEAVGG